MKNDAISTKISIHLAYPKEIDKAVYKNATTSSSLNIKKELKYICKLFLLP